LQYEAKPYGPYAKETFGSFIRLEKHYTLGYGDGKDVPTRPMRNASRSGGGGEGLSSAKSDILERMERVIELIDGLRRLLWAGTSKYSSLGYAREPQSA